MNLLTRDVPPRSAWALEQAGIHPLLARLYAARGVLSKDELDDALNLLLPPAGMLGTTEAAKLLADAIAQNKRLCIVADYDCDGATACAVGVRGLRMLGAQNVSYLVPDRVIDGYGLTPPIAERVHAQGADVLITVDNGIASVAGVHAAQALGLQVLVTDHHLPGNELPSAEVIVNPNQPGCSFTSKSIAGVGVMFYVLLALRAELRKIILEELDLSARVSPEAAGWAAWIGERIGAFRLIGPLGQGGMASVFLAEREDVDFRQRVAVKLLRRGPCAELQQQLFRRERQTLAALTHPAIARLIDGAPECGFVERCGRPLSDLQKPLKEALAKGLIESQPGLLKPTQLGFMFLNDLQGLFLSD